MPGQLFTEYFLTDGIKATAEWRESVLSAGKFGSFRDGVRECCDAMRRSESPNEAVTEQEIVRPALELLGWADYLPQQGSSGNEDIPDHLLFKNAESKERAGTRSSARERYQDALVIEESKRFGLSLDAREKDGGNRSRTPHRQILGYLTTAEIESDGRIRWGILTNGGCLAPVRPPGATARERVLRGRSGGGARTGERGHAPGVLPAVPAGVVHPPRWRGHNVPGVGAGGGEAVRGAGGAGPFERGVRAGLSQSGEGSREGQIGRGAAGGAAGGVDLPVPVALRAVRGGPGSAAGERHAV